MTDIFLQSCDTKEFKPGPCPTSGGKVVSVEKELIEPRRRDIPMQAQTTDCCTERPSDEYIIKEIFTYHSPSPYQAKAYENLRSAAKHLAEVILANVPRGADRTTAIRKLREAIMTANAGIALDGLSL